MSGLIEALIYIIQTLGSLYLLIVLLRFILQLVRADFYNPLSQFIVKATQPPVSYTHLDVYKRQPPRSGHCRSERNRCEIQHPGGQG